MYICTYIMQEMSKVVASHGSLGGPNLARNAGDKVVTRHRRVGGGKQTVEFTSSQ